MDELNEIHFYLANGKYGCFSNFSRHSVFLKGHSWQTVEHFFQAQKFSGSAHETSIRYAHKPMIAASMGRDRSRPLRCDWEEVKDSVMRTAVMAKFVQNKHLTPMLLGTGDRRLVEHTHNDRYWGDGGDGTGLNKLGMILMEVRELIREGKVTYENSDFV